MARPKGRKSRTGFQVERDRALIAELYLQGMSQMQIAVKLTQNYQDEGLPHLEVSQTTVWKELDALRKAWQNETKANMDEIKGVELAKLTALELDYRRGWERSMRDKKKTATKQRGRAAAAPNSNSGLAIQEVEQVSAHEESVGDPRFLDGIGRCIDRRLKLLGLDAPIKTDNTHSFDLSAMSDAELADLRAKYQNESPSSN